MSKPIVIFVHGYGSGASSTKWKYLKSLEDFDVRLVELDYNKIKPDQVIAQISRAYSVDEDPILVGHSLGAFFVAAYARVFSLRALLLNGSPQPWRTLHGKIPEETLTDYRMLNKSWFDTGWAASRAPVIALLELGDEVIDQHKYEQELMYRGVLVKPIEGGNHRFENLDMIYPNLVKLVNSPH